VPQLSVVYDAPCGMWQLRIVRTGGCWRNMALRAPRGACNNYYYMWDGRFVVLCLQYLLFVIVLVQ